MGFGLGGGSEWTEGELVWVRSEWGLEIVLLAAFLVVFTCLLKSFFTVFS